MSIYLKHGKFYSAENHQALTKEHVVEAIAQLEEALQMMTESHDIHSNDLDDLRAGIRELLL